MSLSEARILFKAGKNHDSYFSSDNLIKQVSHAIDIFETKTNGFATGLFLFDNAPSHQKQAPDALSAQKMPKFPNENWSHHKDGPRMWNTTFVAYHPPMMQPITIHQDLYFPDDHPHMPGWFKGMEILLWECGLYPNLGLLAQCKGFKCEPNALSCCCRRLLFTQPDFCTQKSHLKEYITSWGHICDFYLKFHCELNFIEMYWGAVKLRYHVTPKTSCMVQMECNVIECLDDVPLIQIRRYIFSSFSNFLFGNLNSHVRYANCAARFIAAYAQGLTGAEAAWVNRKYHGHQVLPPSMVALVKRTLKSK